jgi:hypothetical protein
LKAAGRATPPAKQVSALIDTGATASGIDLPLLKALDLQPSGEITILTPSTGQGEHRCLTYDISVNFLGLVGGLGGQLFQAVEVLGLDLSRQPIDMLIGQDILKESILIVNGHANFFSLAF